MNVMTYDSVDPVRLREETKVSRITLPNRSLNQTELLVKSAVYYRPTEIRPQRYLLSRLPLSVSRHSLPRAQALVSSSHLRSLTSRLRSVKLSSAQALPSLRSLRRRQKQTELYLVPRVVVVVVFLLLTGSVSHLVSISPFPVLFVAGSRGNRSRWAGLHCGSSCFERCRQLLPRHQVLLRRQLPSPNRICVACRHLPLPPSRLRMSSLSSAVRDLQRELENKTNDLSKLQKDIAKNHQVRKKYTVQLGENELVLKELDLLNEDANVYKLIGPVLVKQDLAEANSNVRKRIEYITAELKRLDATVQDLEEKQNSKKDAILKLQQRIQSLQTSKAKA
ncbi:Prefoldin subunit [Arachis hypogaea]|uniref:Prefoldin subunit n=3 Tax=Arachis TaxID=3817 RepID=A0A6B9V5N7_ARAHY|nr:Prefoldin subunit [Arachis hypogaea]